MEREIAYGGLPSAQVKAEEIFQRGSYYYTNDLAAALRQLNISILHQSSITTEYVVSPNRISAQASCGSPVAGTAFGFSPRGQQLLSLPTMTALYPQVEASIGAAFCHYDSHIAVPSTPSCYPSPRASPRASPATSTETITTTLTGDWQGCLNATAKPFFPSNDKFTESSPAESVEAAPTLTSETAALSPRSVGGSSCVFYLDVAPLNPRAAPYYPIKELKGYVVPEWLGRIWQDDDNEQVVVEEDNTKTFVEDWDAPFGELEVVRI